MSKCILWCSLFLFLFCHASCDLLRPAQDRVAIRVGTEKITLETFQRDLERISVEMDLNPGDVGAVFDLLLERLVERYLILAHGNAQGIGVTEAELKSAIEDIKSDYPSEDEFNHMLLKQYVDYNTWKNQLKERILIDKIFQHSMDKIEPVTFEEIKYYYDNNIDLFKHPEIVKFRQIIISNNDNLDAKKSMLTKEKSFDQLIEDIRERYPSAVVMEEAWATKEEMHETLAEAVFSGRVGLVPSPVKTPHGYHFVNVTDRRAAGVRRLPEVMAGIEERLLAEKREAFYSDWIETLKSRYPVDVDREALDKLETG
jgi:foldase protein PrsA